MFSAAGARHLKTFTTLFTPTRASCAHRGTEDIRNSRHHSHRERGVHPKAFTRNGISVTAACRHRPVKNETAIRRLEPKPAEKTEQSTLRMPTAWKSSESPSTVNAYVWARVRTPSSPRMAEISPRLSSRPAAEAISHGI